MGTGKTTVGRLLADRMGRRFVDMDHIITCRTGLSIPQIFDRYGEAVFRTIEAGICHELATQPFLVIATGGGALVRSDNRSILLQHTLVVCLTANNHTLQSRLSTGEGRPLAPRWQELLEARRTVYDALPNQVNTTDLNPLAVVEEILQIWQRH